MNIDFNANPGKRTTKYLEDQLYSHSLQEAVDLVVFYMKDGLSKMEDAVIESIQSYFHKTKSLYLMIAALFISATIISALLLILLGSRRVKSRLLEFQNLLIIFPLNNADLDHE